MCCAPRGWSKKEGKKSYAIVVRREERAEGQTQRGGRAAEYLGDPPAACEAKKKEGSWPLGTRKGERIAKEGDSTIPDQRSDFCYAWRNDKPNVEEDGKGGNIVIGERVNFLRGEKVKRAGTTEGLLQIQSRPKKKYQSRKVKKQRFL